MAIETQPEQTRGSGGGGPSGATRPRPWWMRPAIHTAIIGAVIGYLVGSFLGSFLTGTGNGLYPNVGLSDSKDWPIVLGYLLAIVGWLAGLGVFNDVVRQMLGRPASAESTQETERQGGVAKYFRYELDHKVVGIQYLAGMIIYFCTAGLFAMAIRTELLSPVHHVFTSQVYVEIVGEHGTMMMMLMTSVILGPFGNYLVPLMIGSKRVAFPRVEALSFWLTPCAFLILLSSLLIGGFPFGWTGYAPLSIQSTVGADSYAMAFGLMGISMILAGFNIIVTVICYRAPGMRWSRLPMFVWAMVTTSFLMVLAAPVLVGGMYMMLTDRTAQTAFFEDTLGGSSYLYQNLFWFFGHPEVYILALPGFGIVLGDHPGDVPQAAVRLQGGRGRHARRRVAELLRLAAPPVHERHQPGHAAAVHADDRADLDPDRVHLPGRARHVLEGEDPLYRAHAVRAGHVLQLPDRRHVRRVPVRRLGGHDRARQLLRDGALPLHDHGRADLRLHGRPVLLAAQDDGDQAE